MNEKRGVFQTICNPFGLPWAAIFAVVAADKNRVMAKL
jgi:hypothetical protein